MPPELPPLEAIRHVHLIAVAGTGMGSLACMLADQGFRVTGSDLDTYPPMSDQLRDAAIEVQKGYVPDHVLREPPDLVVIGNTVRKDNPEARAAIDSGLPYLSFPDAVQLFFMRGKHSVVVTGTHGKTTATSMIGWILTHAGKDPSVLVGGVARNLGGSVRLGRGEHFVIEGDEYDTAFFDKTPKFLHYSARTVLLTSCEFDHADIYSSLADIQAEFRKLIASVPERGRIIAASDSQSVRDVLEVAHARVEGYGFREPALWRVSDVAFDEQGTEFTLWKGERRMSRIHLPLHGRHNVENALGAVAVCDSLGVVPGSSAEALEEFQGVRRRQELRGDQNGFAVIDDFAHHPTAVRETVAATRASYPDRKLWAVFEPRTNTSRRRYFEAELVEALSGADAVILARVFRPEQIPEEERLRPEWIVSELAERDLEAKYLPEVDEIIDHLVRSRTGSDVALIMSNGGFGGIWDRLLARLKQTS